MLLSEQQIHAKTNCIWIVRKRINRGREKEEEEVGSRTPELQVAPSGALRTRSTQIMIYYSGQFKVLSGVNNESWRAPPKRQRKPEVPLLAK